MENTVVGVYDSYTQAQNVMHELLACGFSDDEVRLSPEADLESATQDRASERHAGSGIGHFFRSLFGLEGPEDRQHHDIYAEAMRRGSCVVTVHTGSEQDRERAVEVMNRFDPVDIDERASQWRSQGWTGYDESAPAFTDSEIERDRALHAQARDKAGTEAVPAATQEAQGEQARIPVVEEEMQVGKRTVQRGGVRVYRRVTEQPVHESVQLREEHVNVERHQLDEPASAADMTAFEEGLVEMRETTEEPVVSKTARVVEEVVVGKDTTERTEDIDDTVRKSEVDVEQLGAADRSTTGVTTAADTSMVGGDYADTTMTSDDSDYRTHWQNAYGASGGSYEDYDAAYRYGSMAAGSERYRNYRWEDAEPDLRSDWERDHPESTWERVKDAVRYGAERVTGRQQRS
ncbi:MAG TPA: YsnF/AvaK domain-containing protein [Noviherbaspirillum sp.]|nr:YsnF/AvaK domain-containing protein [Noviherbaspirillum sp.]